jgi:hypothetical protein
MYGFRKDSILVLSFCYKPITVFLKNPRKRPITQKPQGIIGCMIFLSTSPYLSGRQEQNKNPVFFYKGVANHNKPCYLVGPITTNLRSFRNETRSVVGDSLQPHPAFDGVVLRSIRALVRYKNQTKT